MNMKHFLIVSLLAVSLAYSPNAYAGGDKCDDLRRILEDIEREIGDMLGMNRENYDLNKCVALYIARQAFYHQYLLCEYNSSDGENWWAPDPYGNWGVEGPWYYTIEACQGLGYN